jgi:hypothetical protein
MIAPAVFLVALSFWAPYNGGVTPCSNDVAADAVYVTFQKTANGGPAYNAEANIGFDASAFGARLSRAPKAYQAAVIAHEIGHAGMGLRHSEDPTNIMYKFQTVPRFFKQAFPRKRRGRRQAADPRVGTGTPTAQLRT